MSRRSHVLLVTAKRAEKRGVGTGFLLRPREGAAVFVTAFHNVGYIDEDDAVRWNSQIRVFYWTGEKQVDLALGERLAFSHIEDWAAYEIGAPQGTTEFAYSSLDDDAKEWSSYGWPNPKDRPDGNALKGTFEGTETPLRRSGESVVHYELSCSSLAASEPRSGRGYSGGPVLVDDQVIGMIVHRDPPLNQGTDVAPGGVLYALPIERIVEGLRRQCSDDARVWYQVEPAEVRTAISAPSTLLRRDAHSTLGATVRRQQGWRALDHLHDRAHAAIRREISSGDENRVLSVDRSKAASALLSAIAKGPATVVHGESGVGKSALTLSSIADAAGSAAHDLQAVFINLRHLPSTTLELERSLGSPLSGLLGELSAPKRCIVIDGADAIAEGAENLFLYLVDAAHASDVKVVAVSASHSMQIVRDVLVQRFGNSVEDYLVEPLTEAEVDSIIETFSELSRLSENDRSRELLRRLVVVDLLVRGGVTGVPMSNADAMQEVWNGLVRRHGKSDRGSPSAREIALLQLADLALTGGDPLNVVGALDAEALDGLRRDGLLRIPTDDPYTVCPEFAHDEVRRYAMARLFLQAGNPTSKLVAVGAPRWALGAAQIACEAFLSLPDKPANPLAGRFSRQQDAFDGLADAHGERWGDVPGEALLTMSSPTPVLRDAWPGLRAKHDSGLKRLVRLIGQRHVRDGLVSMVVVEPVVSLIIDDGVPSRPDDHIFGLLRDWLRARVLADTSKGHSLRIRLQEGLVRLCEGEEERRYLGERIIELLALLGPDLGEKGEDILRGIGAGSAWRLQPAVESLFVGNALAQLGGGLLADLTEAYCIDDREAGHFSHEAIRDHDARTVGMLSPLAAWYRGPFMSLFRHDFRGGVAVLNRMLNHATLFRAQVLAQLNHRFDDGALDPYRTELSVTGKRVVYIGDSHVWLWYRGTGVGPYPCMSGLQALERVCDQFIEAGVPLANLIQILLDGSESLAMVGLVVGLLVRRPQTAGRLLDPYFVEPFVWRLEFARATAEMVGFPVRSPEGPSEPESRRWHLRDAAMILVFVLSDEKRVVELRALGAKLVENECRDIAKALGCETSEVMESDDPQVKRSLAEVRVWAACLDKDTYSAQVLGDGIGILSKPPDEATEALERENEDARRGRDAIRLTVKYYVTPKKEGSAVDVSAEDLTTDLGVARELLEHPPTSNVDASWDTPTAVAAVALEAHLLRGVALSDEWLEFASGTVLRVCEGEPGPRMYESENSHFEQGADRSAARVVPLLLIPSARSIRSILGRGDTQSAYQRALEGAISCGRARVDEVRLHLARGLDHVWETVCAEGECHHEAGLRIAVESMRDCACGDWLPAEQRFSIIELEDPIAESLADSPDNRIVFTRLDAGIRALAVAATSGICVAHEARKLLESLLAAQRRALLSHEHNMDDRGSHALVAVRAMLLVSASGDSKLIFEHIDAYADRPDLLRTLLRALSAAAEEEPTLAKAAQDLWPSVIRHVLELHRQGHAPFGGRDGKRALGALLPNAAGEVEYLYREVAEKPIVWWDPNALLGEIDAWIPLATGDANCVDRFITMIGALPLDDQVRLGLSRVAELVQSDTSLIVQSSWHIADWLIASRAYAANAGKAEDWQRIVDVLVVAGASKLAPYST